MVRALLLRKVATKAAVRKSLDKRGEAVHARGLSDNRGKRRSEKKNADGSYWSANKQKGRPKKEPSHKNGARSLLERRANENDPTLQGGCSVPGSSVLRARYRKKRTTTTMRRNTQENPSPRNAQQPRWAAGSASEGEEFAL